MSAAYVVFKHIEEEKRRAKEQSERFEKEKKEQEELNKKFNKLREELEKFNKLREENILEFENKWNKDTIMKDKISLQDIEDNIKHIEIVKHITHSGKILRWAVITTESGFAVTGRPSATINQANDNVEIGEKVAIDNAKSEMWALMGYHLSVKINEEKGALK